MSPARAVKSCWAKPCRRASCPCRSRVSCPRASSRTRGYASKRVPARGRSKSTRVVKAPSQSSRAPHPTAPGVKAKKFGYSRPRARYASHRSKACAPSIRSRRRCPPIGKRSRATPWAWATRCGWSKSAAATSSPSPIACHSRAPCGSISMARATPRTTRSRACCTAPHAWNAAAHGARACGDRR